MLTRHAIIVYILSMRTVLIRNLDPDVHKRLRHVCLDRGESMNTTLLRLIEQYVKQQEKQKSK